MWGNRQGKLRSKRTTLVARGAVIEGQICFEGCLEVEGAVHGNISVQGEDGPALVRILESGRVQGEIRAPTVIINGAVRGDVYASEHLELAANAVVDGDVYYHLLEMMKGAQVNGALVHREGGGEGFKENSSADKPDLMLPARLGSS